MNIHTFLLAIRSVIYIKLLLHPQWQYFLCHSLHGDQSSILLHRRHTGMAYYIYCKGSNFCCSALFSTRACLGYPTLPAIVMRIFCCAHLGEILTTTVRYHTYILFNFQRQPCQRRNIIYQSVLCVGFVKKSIVLLQTVRPVNVMTVFSGTSCSFCYSVTNLNRLIMQ